MNSENQSETFKSFMKSLWQSCVSWQRAIKPRAVNCGAYWKIPFTIFALLLSAQTPSYGAQSVTLQWVANAESDLAGYRVYQTDTRGQYVFGPSSPQLAAEIPTGPDPGGIVTHTLINIPDGAWYWVVTAYDIDGLESGPSNEVPPPTPDSTLTGVEAGGVCLISTAASD
jgi:hypothetical protein